MWERGTSYDVKDPGYLLPLTKDSGYLLPLTKDPGYLLPLTKDPHQSVDTEVIMITQACLCQWLRPAVSIRTARTLRAGSRMQR